MLEQTSKEGNPSERCEAFWVKESTGIDDKREKMNFSTSHLSGKSDIYLVTPFLSQKILVIIIHMLLREPAQVAGGTAELYF